MSDPVQSLIFVYNADGGLLSRLTDSAHKLLSPSTYSCNLCAITHGAMGMHREWRAFLERIGLPIEFAHRDEWDADAWGPRVALPVILAKRANAVAVLVDAATIEAATSQAQLQECILTGLGRPGSAR